jgi:hypothetical protein
MAESTTPLACAGFARTELFRAFNRLALQGFGGVLPVAQRELVERQRWLSREQFVETLSLGQVLPGPNIVNLALMIGDRFFGLRGAIGLAGRAAAGAAAHRAGAGRAVRRSWRAGRRWPARCAAWARWRPGWWWPRR